MFVAVQINMLMSICLCQLIKQPPLLVIGVNRKHAFFVVNKMYYCGCQDSPKDQKKSQVGQESLLTILSGQKGFWDAARSRNKVVFSLAALACTALQPHREARPLPVGTTSSAVSNDHYSCGHNVFLWR